MVNATAEPWYQYFHEDGTTQSWVLLAVYGFRTLWATLGLLLNVSIVHATWISKSLHGVCNILIAVESFMAIIMDASYYVTFVIFLIVKFIPYHDCFPIMLPMNIFAQSVQMALVLTGADRLLCVMFPIWYKTRRRWHCLCVYGAFLLGYTIYCIIIIRLDFLLSDQSFLLSCSIYEFGRSEQLAPLKNVNGMVLSSTIMAIYTLVFLITFVLYPNTVNDKNKRLIKSLTFIIGMNLIGVFVKTTMSFMLNTYWKGADVFVKNTYAIGMSFVTIAVYSSNAPVLYIVSKEYRSQIQQLFWLRPFLVNSRQPSLPDAHTNHQPLTVHKPGNSNTIQRKQQQIFNTRMTPITP